jgi:serine/threonine-protein kinase
MGSPHYMSPEQMRSTRDVDLRTDIWALGVILYELVSGRVPFDAETMPQLCSQVLEEAPARLTVAPPPFESLVLRCLEKDPKRRFVDVLELAVALGAFAPPEGQRSIDRIARLRGSRSGSERPSGPALANEPAGVTGATGPSRATFALTTREHRRRQFTWVALSAAGVVAVLAWLFLKPAPEGAALPAFGSGEGASRLELPEPPASVRSLEVAPQPQYQPAPSAEPSGAPALNETGASNGKRDKKKKPAKRARRDETPKATPVPEATPEPRSTTPDPLNGRL